MSVICNSLYYYSNSVVKFASRLTVGNPGLDVTTELIVIRFTIRANSVVTFVIALLCYHLQS